MFTFFLSYLKTYTSWWRIYTIHSNAMFSTIFPALAGVGSELLIAITKTTTSTTTAPCGNCADLSVNGLDCSVLSNSCSIDAISGVCPETCNAVPTCCPCEGCNDLSVSGLDCSVLSSSCTLPGISNLCPETCNAKPTCCP